MKITITNWDDIVRAEKRKAYENKERVESFTWGTEGWNILQEFHKVLADFKYKKGGTYFGVKHYHDPALQGYTVQR